MADPDGDAAAHRDDARDDDHVRSSYCCFLAHNTPQHPVRDRQVSQQVRWEAARQQVRDKHGAAAGGKCAHSLSVG